MIQIQPTLTPVPISLLGLRTDWFRDGPRLGWSRMTPRSDSLSNGSSCKADGHALTAAVGELLERLGFSFRKDPEKALPLSEMGEDRLAADLYSALWQTTAASAVHERRAKSEDQINRLRKSLDHHPFRVRRGFTFLDGEPRFLPEVILTLETSHPDRSYYPLSDSVGCGFQHTPQLSILTAFMEWFERQSILLHWLTGFIEDEWKVQPEHLDPCACRLWKRLNEAGILRAFEISPFPGISCSLLILTAPESYPVRFSVASAASFHPQEALESALLECWQTYRFLIGHPPGTPVPPEMDFYQADFLQKNHPETCYQFPAWHHPLIRKPLPVNELSPIQPFDIIAGCLGRFDLNPVLYLDQIRRGSRIGCLSKVVEPRGFLNMSIAHSNVDNALLDHLNLSLIPENASSQLPFP